MEALYGFFRLLHVVSFVFMSVPLFNLTVVNEKAMLNANFDYHVERYMENIIGRGAYRCFVFQSSVLISGVFLLILGSLGIEALWGNWIISLKFLLLIILMGLLSYVHFRLQPRIEELMKKVSPQSEIPPDFMLSLKPYRVLRKRLATVCLFLVLTIIIFGLQVYNLFPVYLTVILIALAALFSIHANKTLIRFGWL